MKHQKYKLERNPNGTVTQVLNADGGSIYDARPELRKLNEEALNRPTPGKLGQLGNLQVFNANFTSTLWPTGNVSLNRQYNETETTGNLTDSVGFSNNGFDEYYNILAIDINLYGVNNAVRLQDDSYVSFYLCQNDGTSSTINTGQKIPRRTKLGVDGGDITWTTDGAKVAFQSVSVPVSSGTNTIPTNTKGLRASGLALKTIFLNSPTAEDWTTCRLELVIYVDATSVSTTF